MKKMIIACLVLSSVFSFAKHRQKVIKTTIFNISSSCSEPYLDSETATVGAKFTYSKLTTFEKSEVVPGRVFMGITLTSKKTGETERFTELRFKKAGYQKTSPSLFRNTYGVWDEFDLEEDIKEAMADARYECEVARREFIKKHY